MRGWGSLAKALIRRVQFGRRYGSARFSRRYHEGKTHQDTRRELTRALAGVVALDGAVVVDVGCGTGQLLDQFGDRIGEYIGIDPSPYMIDVARRVPRDATVTDSYRFEIASAEQLPLEDASADLVIYPWSMNSIVTATRREDWADVLEAAISEGERILRDGGTLAVVESLSYAGELPWGEIWHPGRKAFLGRLESAYGMDRVLFANEWEFGSRANTRRCAGIWFDRNDFIGPEGEPRTSIVECAGIWWRRVSGR